MSRLSNKVDPAAEEFVVHRLCQETGLKGHLTPQLARADFFLFDNQDYKVVGDIKCRDRFYSDWFVSDPKRLWLEKTAKHFGVIPWFVVWCLENDKTYILNLSRDYAYVEGDCTNHASTGKKTDWGRYVQVQHWKQLEPSRSFDGRMSAIDWK